MATFAASESSTHTQFARFGARLVIVIVPDPAQTPPSTTATDSSVSTWAVGVPTTLTRPLQPSVAEEIVPRCAPRGSRSVTS